MNPVESRPLRYFVAVAEELSFSRAAQRLHIAAPALSRAIAALESELDATLFERSTRHVSLTETGATLLAEARPALQALDAATLRARRTSEMTGAVLRLAVKADVEGGLLEPILEAYRDEHPDVPIEVVFTGWGDQPDLVRAGEVDAAVVVEPFDRDGLDTEPLLTEPMLLAMPATHPLTGSSQLRLADLEVGHDRVTPDAHVYVPRGTQRPDFSDMTQMLRQIELGRMLALLPASLATRTTRPKLTWRTVDDASPATFAIAWPTTSRSKAVAALVRVAIGVAASRDKQP